MSGIIASIAAKSAKNAEELPGDYFADGLLYCGKCHTPKQSRITIGGEAMTVGCMCRCRSEQYERDRLAEKAAEAQNMSETLRSVGIQDRSLHAVRFDTLEPAKELEACRRYVERWDEMRRENIGLLLWGQTGNGKTAAAACIANALIDRGVPVLFTSAVRILNSGFDRAELIRQMHEYPLVVLDDLGAERQTDYSLEVLFLTVNERYKAGRPLVVTTNLTPAEMRASTDVSYQRIYSRILELCVPVVFAGKSRRPAAAARKARIARELMA